MSHPRATFNKDLEDIVQKFSKLNKAADEIRKNYPTSGGILDPFDYYAVRTSALNLLARTAGESSVYYRELRDMSPINPGILAGILHAASTDFREGFMADTKLLVSAEVLADFLVQAEVLLEHDYKDAAAVVIRAVLEDGLRACVSLQGHRSQGSCGGGRPRTGAHEAERAHCHSEERD